MCLQAYAIEALSSGGGGNSLKLGGKYRGKEQKAPASIAFYNFFNIQLEFIVPIGEDKTVWSDYLELGAARPAPHPLRCA